MASELDLQRMTVLHWATLQQRWDSVYVPLPFRRMHWLLVLYDSLFSLILLDYVLCSESLLIANGYYNGSLVSPASCLDPNAWIDSMGITQTLMTVTRHTADVAYSILNFSIISVTNVSSGEIVTINASELLACYNATFNNLDPNSLYLGTQVLI